MIYQLLPYQTQSIFLFNFSRKLGRGRLINLGCFFPRVKNFKSFWLKSQSKFWKIWVFRCKFEHFWLKIFSSIISPFASNLIFLPKFRDICLAQNLSFLGFLAQFWDFWLNFEIFSFLAQIWVFLGQLLDFLTQIYSTAQISVFFGPNISSSTHSLIYFSNS